MRSISTALIACAMLLAFGCTRKPSSPLPVSGDVSGWTKSGETRSFDAANLWRYIDGDAERYLQAGFETVSTADYKAQNKVDAVVDLYSMRDAAGAQKIFDNEPARGAQPASLGDAGRVSARSMLFRKGRYLVRVVAYDEVPGGQQTLLDLGHAIEGRLR